MITTALLAAAALDWQTMFTPTVSPFELFLRATGMYLAVLLVLRLMRRQKGALTGADFLAIVLIAEAARNSVASDFRSITEGVVMVAVVYLWEYGLEALSVQSPRLRSLLNGGPLMLIRDGRLLRQNLRRVMLSRAEIQAQLRELGIEHLRDVRQAYLDADGRISALLNSDVEHMQRSRIVENMARA
ncbi:MAG TPA: YetF domain-containing protein [Gemmatimonas sp.]|uniref:DUF421 domain-containing protein n=1 Tax=Gemmatimonas sp. TaxID=1962908 RepID=UPI002ED98B6B